MQRPLVCIYELTIYIEIDRVIYTFIMIRMLDMTDFSRELPLVDSVLIRLESRS